MLMQKEPDDTEDFIMAPTIALDHDSTLAATAETAFDLIDGPDHGYAYDDIETWAWGLREFGMDCYLSALWHAWTLRPLAVPPMEPNLNHTVAELRRHATVEIVTAHPDHSGISAGKQAWLADNDIEYDAFRAVEMGTSKATLGYDYYVDDKPSLPAEANKMNPDATVYLRDQPYNQDAPGDYIRVNTVAEAMADITERVRVSA